MPNTMAVEVFASHSLTPIKDGHHLTMLEKRLMGNSAVYIGCGNDVAPIRLFTRIRTFIYVEVGEDDELSVGKVGSLSQMNNAMKNIGFTGEDSETESHLRIYRDDHRRTVYYYYNHLFPRDLTTMMKRRILMATTLINIGVTYDAKFFRKCHFRAVVEHDKCRHAGSENDICFFRWHGVVKYPNQAYAFHNRRKLIFFKINVGDYNKPRESYIQLQRCTSYCELGNFMDW